MDRMSEVPPDRLVYMPQVDVDKDPSPDIDGVVISHKLLFVVPEHLLQL
jgi:hypothetical protein